jgi:LCP family protein required for cell wall assembly
MMKSMRGTRLRAGLVAAATVVCAASGLAACSSHRGAKVVIGVPKPTTTTAAPGPTIPVDTTDPPPVPAAATRGGRTLFGGLAAADGHPWPPAIEFTSAYAVPSDLVFILVVGGDARPGQDLLHSHADSIHLLCVNPRTLEATALGIPRDSWVEIPGHGQGKINSAMSIGGPDLMSATVRKVTGLPVNYWVVTGFPGLQQIVDELGGIDVYVDQRMNDPDSGARFQPGWHHMTGGQALAYSRDRHDVPQGDFSRSLHQGELIRAALAKARSTIGDDDGIARWTRILLRHAQLDVPMDKLAPLGALARRLDVLRVKNVVTPGRIGTARGQSVVFLGAEAARLFDDIRPDAVVGTPSEPPTSSSSSTTTTTTGPLPTTSSTVPLTTPTT